MLLVFFRPFSCLSIIVQRGEPGLSWEAALYKLSVIIIRERERESSADKKERKC